MTADERKRFMWLGVRLSLLHCAVAVTALMLVHPRYAKPLMWIVASPAEMVWWVVTAAGGDADAISFLIKGPLALLLFVANSLRYGFLAATAVRLATRLWGQGSDD